MDKDDNFTHYFGVITLLVVQVHCGDGIFIHNVYIGTLHSTVKEWTVTTPLFLTLLMTTLVPASVLSLHRLHAHFNC